ncbi:MAG: bifunctional methylenetetrahydrofolate dehydrogenase/methenyltetrahydrofolate cyclohydrolase FolD [Candidatus Eisenbacteria bacterium]|nr:bifunctional methylenetetrahydrofolate dehydrogenase/methenyltetrahydrofolate cyclohydrolase FolD [Candidatus Eisenbacteria bacterium]
MARILDGKQAAAALRERVRAEANALRADGVTPHLVMIRVGEDPASAVYVRAKEKASASTGIESRTSVLPAETSQEALAERIADLNRDPRVSGILLQLPVPAHISEEEMIAAIDPAKDVDGFHPISMGRLLLELPTFISATPLGILHLLAHYEIPVAGRRVVIVGRSRIVGRPLANLLSSRAAHGNATVTLCHTRTRDLGARTREAELLIAAAGRKRLITAEMVAPGAVVVDVGIHREPDPNRPGKQRLCGDVDFPAVSEIAGAITPVPGGVGPMTVAALMANTVAAARRQSGRSAPQR